MSVYMIPAGVKYVTQVFQCMTPAGVNNSIVTPAGVKYFNYDFCRSQVFQCMTPAGVKNVSMHDSRKSQVSPC